MLSRRWKKKKLEAVSVHVFKLQELPEPLSMLEFREVCQDKGMPVELSHPRAKSSLLELASVRDAHDWRVRERWNNTASNLFGAYMAIHGLFKNWHNALVQKRDVDPASVREHEVSQLPAPPFLGAVTPRITERETMHVIKQRELVNVLIDFGIGLPVPGLDDT